MSDKPLWDALRHQIDRQRPARHVDHEAQAFAKAATAPKAPATLMPKLLACALVVTLVALIWWSRPRPQAPPALVQMAAVSTPFQGVPGEPWSVQPALPQDQLLEDGTRLVLGPHAQTHIAHRPGHTLVTLAQGVVHVQGQHTLAQTWQLQAGPYTVTLLGTAFEASWSPHDQRFHLTLEEGLVQVEGPGLFTPLQMHPADSVSLHVPQPSASEPLPGLLSATPDSDAKPAPRPARVPPWRALAKQKKYAQAMDAAQKDGLEMLCRREPTAKLLELADVARFANRRSEAAHVLKCLRTRGAPAAQRATAAYLLGQIARQTGQPQDAIRWLSLYLKEAPKGPLARETMGQLMDLYPPPQARSLATSYLEQFPTGPHAARAQRLLSSAP